jgi:DNA helicase IV
VRPAELVRELLTDDETLAAAAEGVLTAAEQAAIAKTTRDAWTAADLLLIDEVDGLVQSRSSYGHVIVDEAQDLSPMQCRAIARRSLHGSLTVLGDLAQGGRPWSASDWPTQLAHLGAADASVVELTVGYRVPGVVVELANRILAALPVDVPPGTSYRADGELRTLPVADLAGGVVDAVTEAMTYEGSIGVIASPGMVQDVTKALRDKGVPVARIGEFDKDARVTVLSVEVAKGLEYDHVVVAEPADIVESGPRGPHLLYIAVTRAVSRLDLVHARDLPAQIS